MSKLETNTIDTISGTANLTIGGANNTGTTTIKSNNTAAITVDSSQNVGIGTTSPASLFHIDGTNPKITVGTSGSNVTFLQRVSDDFYIFNRESAGELLFGTADTERMRIDSSGRVGIGTSSPVRKLQVSNGFIGASENSADITSNQYNEFSDNSSNWYNTKFHNHSVSPASQYMIEVGFVDASPDNSAAKFFQMLDTTTARINIDSDGDVYNHDGTYGTISDERIKQNIVDAGSQWNDIKNIRVRKYKKKHDVIQYGEENAPIEIGVISQELEAVSPGLIKEDKADKSHAELHEDFAGENPQNVKYVKYSILYMKSIKALQEAMARIETLEAKNTELEARITALENA